MHPRAQLHMTSRGEACRTEVRQTPKEKDRELETGKLCIAALTQLRITLSIFRAKVTILTTIKEMNTTFSPTELICNLKSILRFTEKISYFASKPRPIKSETEWIQKSP